MGTSGVYGPFRKPQIKTPFHFGHFPGPSPCLGTDTKFPSVGFWCPCLVGPPGPSRLHRTRPCRRTPFPTVSPMNLHPLLLLVPCLLLRHKPGLCNPSDCHSGKRTVLFPRHPMPVLPQPTKVDSQNSTGYVHVLRVPSPVPVRSRPLTRSRRPDLSQ